MTDLTPIFEADDFQREARKTAIYPDQGSLNGLIYCVLGLAGEAGELANTLKKVLRDDSAKVRLHSLVRMKAELEDVAWYLAATASELGINLSVLFGSNIERLKDRQDRGKIGGSGDTR